MSRSVTPPYDQLRALEAVRIVPPAKATVTVEGGTTYVNVELTEEQAAMFRESTLAPQFSIRKDTE